MASKYVKDLREVSKTQKALGFDWSAGVCEAAADRMERMEEYIVYLKEFEGIDDELFKGDK